MTFAVHIVHRQAGLFPHELPQSKWLSAPCNRKPCAWKCHHPNRAGAQFPCRWMPATIWRGTQVLRREDLQRARRVQMQVCRVHPCEVSAKSLKPSATLSPEVWQSCATSEAHWHGLLTYFDALKKNPLLPNTSTKRHSFKLGWQWDRADSNPLQWLGFAHPWASFWGQRKSFLLLGRPRQWSCPWKAQGRDGIPALSLPTPLMHVQREVLVSGSVTQRRICRAVFITK